MASEEDGSQSKIKKADDINSVRKKQMIYELGADATCEFDKGEFIHFNKMLLALESKYFSDIFFGSSQATNVKIQDFDRESFQTFLDCLFGLKEYSALDALIIYPIAHKYGVEKCIRKCVSVLQAEGMNENVCQTLNLASYYNDVELLDDVMHFLEHEVKIVNFLENESYVDLLEPSAVSKIVECTKMNSHFWKIIYRWGETYIIKSNKTMDISSLFRENNILSELSLDDFESVQSILDFHDYSNKVLLDSDEILNFLKRVFITKKIIMPENSCWVEVKNGEKIVELIKFKHSYRIPPDISDKIGLFRVSHNTVYFRNGGYFKISVEYISKVALEYVTSYCSRDWPSDPTGSFDSTHFSLNIIPKIVSRESENGENLDFRFPIPELKENSVIKGLRITYIFLDDCKILKTSVGSFNIEMSEQLCFTKFVNFSLGYRRVRGGYFRNLISKK